MCHIDKTDLIHIDSKKEDSSETRFPSLENVCHYALQ